MTKIMEGYIQTDFLAMSVSAITLWRCWSNGVPWYICLGMYGLIAVGIDSVIDSAIKAKKEKHASKA